MATSFETFSNFRAAVAATPARSKWARAVREDALDLLDNLEGEIPGNALLLKKALLNGASDWADYSWGGNHRCYNTCIAEHYCTPSELRRVTTKNGGVRSPNSREDWCDVQARALAQAGSLVLRVYREFVANCEILGY